MFCLRRVETSHQNIGQMKDIDLTSRIVSKEQTGVCMTRVLLVHLRARDRSLCTKAPRLWYYVGSMHGASSSCMPLGLPLSSSLAIYPLSHWRIGSRRHQYSPPRSSHQFHKFSQLPHSKISPYQFAAFSCIVLKQLQSWRWRPE